MVSAVFTELERDADVSEYTILIETIRTLPDSIQEAYESILKKCPEHKMDI